MGTFKDSLKKWFYTQGTQAASATARIPLLDASGNPIGSDTIARMADVLGVDLKKITLVNLSTNIDDLSSGVYYGSLKINNGNQAGYLITFRASDVYRFQIFFSYSSNSNKVLHRSRGADGWSTWSLASDNIPDFYKNYADLTALTNSLVAQNALSIGNVMVVTNADSYTHFWPADRALESGIANIAVGAGIIENGRTLIIAKDTTTKKWAESNVAGGNSYLGREAAVADFNGRTNTNKILETLGDNAPAATYCHTYHPANVDSADTNMGAGRWWLPSLGELAMIWAHVREINFVLSAIGGTQIPVGSGWMWSSTENSATYAWYLITINGSFDNLIKTYELSVRPVSAFY